MSIPISPPRLRRIAAGLTAITVVAAGAVIALANEGDTVVGTTAERTERDGGGDVPAAPLAFSTKAPEGPFTVTYTESNLAHEETAPDGRVLLAAVLKERSYHLKYHSQDHWELTEPGTENRWLWHDGRYQIWEAGEVTVDHRPDHPMAPPRPALSVDRERLAVDARTAGYERSVEARADDGTRERYRRQISRPDGEHYLSLPWKDTGNEDVIVVDYDDEDRLRLYRETLNGTVTYEYRVH